MEQFLEFIINHWILSLALVVIAGLLISSELGQHIGGVKQVGPAEATKMVNHKNALLLDVREKSDQQDGLLPGAISLPCSEIEARLAELEKYRQQPVITFCKNGQKGKRACGVLSKQGFDSLYNLDGGLLAWQTANMPVQKSG
jgi:rhodanese-related sulfurtransferase